MQNNAVIKEYTTGGVPRALLTFSWPFMLSNLMQLLYNMVDMAVVGRFVDSASIAAVSNGGDIMNLATLACMGISAAGQVVIAQYVGKRDAAGIRRAIGSIFTLLGSLSLVVMFLGFIFSDRLLLLLKVPAEAFAQAREYCVVCFCGMFFIYGYNVVSAILRGMGNSKLPFVFISVATVVNLVLDLLFVAVFGWGVWGAAAATVLGQAVSFSASAVYLYRYRERFGFDFAPRRFIPDRPILKEVLKLGVPMSLQYSAISLSKMFVNSFINDYGLVASTVNGIGVKIGQVAHVVTQALAAASTTMIGQNFGAGKQDRIRRIVYVTMACGLAFTVALSVVMLIFPEQIFGLFDANPQVRAMSHIYAVIAVLNYVASALRSPVMALSNGLGNSRMSLIIGLLDGIVCRIGLAVLMGVTLGMGIVGFWLGDVCAGFVPFVIGGVYFWSGAWKKRRGQSDQ
jgi:putative MATE family efflux protein